MNSKLEVVASGMNIATRVLGDEYTELFKHMAQTEFCVKNSKRQLLQLVLNPFWTQSCLKALQHCFADPVLDEMQKDISDYLRIVRSKFKGRHLAECAVFAIANDDDLALMILIVILKTHGYVRETIELPNNCEILGKKSPEGYSV